MVVLSEGRRAASFILSEAPGIRSRESVTFGYSQNIPAGGVIGGPIAATSDVPAHYVEYNPANSPAGSNVVAGVSIYPVVTPADKQVSSAIIARDAEVNDKILGWKSGMTTLQKTAGRAALALLGIIAR